MCPALSAWANVCVRLGSGSQLLDRRDVLAPCTPSIGRDLRLRGSSLSVSSLSPKFPSSSQPESPRDLLFPFSPCPIRSKNFRRKCTVAPLPDVLLFPVPSPGVIRLLDIYQGHPPTFFSCVHKSSEEPQSGLLSRGLEALSTDILLKPDTGTHHKQPQRQSRSVSLLPRPPTLKQSASAPYYGL